MADSRVYIYSDWSVLSARCSTRAGVIATPRSPRSARARRLWLVGVLAGAALLAAGGRTEAQAGVRAATTIATVHSETDVRAWNGVQAWTDYNSADERWHVVVRSAGQIAIPAAIPAGTQRPKVDVGPGPDGTPTLVFVSCTDACRVVISGVNGARARTVPGSAGASSPTIWGSRVAWLRGKNTVLTRRLGAPGTTRLAGVPRRICYAPFKARRRCERTTDASVQDLELNGSRLAIIDHYWPARGATEGGTSEVRIQSVHGGRQRLVASINVGIAGQSWIGPSWVKGDLFFYKSCHEGVGGCVRGGAYRYDAASRTYALAASREVLAGFAMHDDGRRAFEALGGTFSDCADEPGVGTCPLWLTDRLTFTRTRSAISAPG